MSSFRSRLASLEFWFHLAGLIAVPGLLCGLVGFFVGSQQLIRIGVYFFYPLLLVCALLVLVMFPVLIIANWRMRRK